MIFWKTFKQLKKSYYLSNTIWVVAFKLDVNLLLKGYLEPCQASKMKFSAKLISG